MPGHCGLPVAPSRTLAGWRARCRHPAGHPGAAPWPKQAFTRRDRTITQRIYARSGIREYWLVAIPDKRLEVYRDPTGDGYRTISMHRTGDAVAPLARPATAIAVDDLLP